MHSDHPLADNLFGRLQTYSPREGREPLEDFCTEALSYCLRSLPALRTEFLKWISSSLVRDGAPQPEIHTQLSYRPNEDAGAGEAARKGGRFDLVLESQDYVIVVEVKVWSDFRENQLDEYRRQLDRGTRFADRKCQKFLVTITPRSAPSVAPHVTVDAHIKWSTLQVLLESLGRAGSDSTSLVCREFAEFLKEKGLAPMHLSKINAPGPMSLLEALQLQFCQTVEGGLDGDAEAIRDWLVRATLDLVELGELLTQRRQAR